MDLTPHQKQEIEESRAAKFETRRVTSAALEEILYNPIPVLDHGFVRVIDYMGDDAAIVQAARVSYGKGTKKVSDDAGLINYLLRHRHTTPFEMCEIKYHVKVPIFIARQWIRHRTANVNEYSARYSVLDREFYIPSADQLAMQSKQNHQGRGEVLEGEEAQHVLDLLKEDATRNYDHYIEMLNEDPDGNIIDEERGGLARELARMNLTLNAYTQWYWKIDLHNLMHFLALRFDPHAQYEIRVYAKIMTDILKKWVPLTYEAFIRNKVGSLTLSSDAVNYLQSKLNDKSFDESKVSKRELDNLKKIFNLS